jgi:hypothetical protein
VASDQAHDDLSGLVEEIRRGLPAAPGGMSAPEFSLLCENIARAIVHAIDTHGPRAHTQEPEFGEEERIGL